MPNLTREQFAEVERLFFEAGRLGGAERAALLEQPGLDPRVREEVESLLHASHIEQPVPPLTDCIHRAMAASDDSHLLVGQRVNEYEITGIIGRGGMGVVYRATDTRLHRTVAIKAIPSAYEPIAIG